MPRPEQEYLKISAAATYLGISANTLRRYTDLAVVRAKRLPGGDRLYRREWLDEFVESLPEAIQPPQPMAQSGPREYNPPKSDLSLNPRRGD